MQRFTQEQRERIIQAARDARTLGMRANGWDAVDLACETNNYFWTGLNNRQARVALRLVHLAAGTES